MPDRIDYQDLSIDELQERLVAAETVCVLFGWAPMRGKEEDPLVQAWIEWNDHVGEGYTAPSAHPDLNEKRIHDLTIRRRWIREQTLKRIRDTKDEPQ